MPTIVTPATIAKIKPPKAPQDKYDFGNEDFFRRLVAKLLRDFANDINTNGGTGGGGGTVNVTLPFPNSGIIGWNAATGNGTNPAYLQLLNPSGSGINLSVYEMYVSFVAHATNTDIYGKITSTPATLTSPNTAALQRMDENDSAPIKSKLYSGAVGGSILTTGDFVISGGTIEGGSGFTPFPIRTPFSFPIILPPGWAVEISADTASIGTTIRAQVVLDENAV